MPGSTAILSLGTREDATTWEKGCKGLGLDAPNPIKKGSPNESELRAFFRSTPDWIFLAGHFGSLELSNEGGSVAIAFSNEEATVTLGENTFALKKGTADFALDAKCQVVLWGGCSVCSGEDTIRTMRTLFGPHVLLGFNGLTGWKLVDAILGGGFIPAGKHFFDRVAGKEGDATAIRVAWMETAKFGYGGGKAESKFRAIDPDGREWMLVKGEIKRGRSFA